MADSDITKDTAVIHQEYGSGSVMFAEDGTAVVRFGHGIEQVLLSELKPIESVSSVISSLQPASSLEVVTRTQGSVITAINNMWGVFTRSRISLLPHQLWVCHRALQKWPIKLLIADDVGMGKTIEAGLMLWPLIESRKVQRLLILSPPKLVEQWQIRLKSMFDIRAAIYTPEQDNNRTDFWGIHNIVIASLPTLRTDNNGRIERLLGAPVWDMVIVDEAHHLNADEQTGKTLGYQLLERLNKSGKITSCVLFTATPHRGKAYGFWSLMGLLDDQVFGTDKNKAESVMLKDLPDYLIRNSKQKAVDMQGNRLFKPIKQFPETFYYTPEEEHFYQLMTSFIQEGQAYASSLSQTQRGQVALVLIALQKLASSSVAAVTGALHTRINRLSEEAKLFKEEVAALERNEAYDELAHAMMQWVSQERKSQLLLMENESKYLNELIEAARLVTHETRIDRIIEVIKERFANEPVLLFTEYKQTQALMVSALMQEFGEDSVSFINGDDRLDNVLLPSGRKALLSIRRESACEKFNNGSVRFLVATEAGGEGIDLQERCSALIHVDLPWNPMRLHQRVGRLNRYGQKNTVRVVSLRNPGTVESRIWSKLEEKLQSIMLALGTAMDEPEDLMQLVLGMSGENLFNELFTESKDVSKERLDSWFDAKTGSLGNKDAVEAIKDLVGHADSFDLSDLKRVPPVDVPDLLPFFQNILTLNRRRPKAVDMALSFRTPDEWLKNNHVIKRSYDNIVFERNAPKDFDMMGVGHPLFSKATNEAAQLEGVFAVVKNAKAPLMVFEVVNRLTGKNAGINRVIVGVTEKDAELVLIKDWEILQLINSYQVNTTPESIESEVGGEVSAWGETAKNVLPILLEKMELPFIKYSIEESSFFWSFSFKSEAVKNHI